MSIVSMVPRLIGYGKRIAKVTPELILGTGSDVIGAAARAQKGSVLTKARAGFRALEADIATKSLTQGGFFKRLWTNLKTTPKAIGQAAKAGSVAAKAAGKSGIWGGIKGFFKGVSSKMPFIGAALMLLGEIPNIYSATKEQGIGQGVKETVKAGARLGGGAVGAAIGSAICPGIGSLVGWIAGEWLTSKVVGKSYTEQKYEAEEALAQQQMAQQQGIIQPQEGQLLDPQPTFQGNTQTGMTNPMANPYAGNYNNPYAMPYENDIMMQNLNFNAIA